MNVLLLEELAVTGNHRDQLSLGHIALANGDLEVSTACGITLTSEAVPLELYHL